MIREPSFRSDFRAVFFTSHHRLFPFRIGEQASELLPHQHHLEGKKRFRNSFYLVRNGVYLWFVSLELAKKRTAHTQSESKSKKEKLNNWILTIVNVIKSLKRNEAQKTVVQCVFSVDDLSVVVCGFFFLIRDSKMKLVLLILVLVCFDGKDVSFRPYWVDRNAVIVSGRLCITSHLFSLLGKFAVRSISIT